MRENVAYRAYEEGQDETEIEGKVRQTLGFVGLEDAIEKSPAELSGGMKRRVALARALISEPEIMLYDEPTAGLDPVTSRKINELIIALRDINNVTGIFVTHRMRDAFTRIRIRHKWRWNVKFTMRIIFLHRKHPVSDAPRWKDYFEGPDELRRRIEYIQAFSRLGGQSAQRRSLAWTELRVGILVISSFALLALAIFFITGESGFLTPKYIESVFSECNNSSPGPMCSSKASRWKRKRVQVPNCRTRKKLWRPLSDWIKNIRTSFAATPR